MKNRDSVIKKFLQGYTSSYMYCNKNDTEEVFFSLVEKVIHNEKLSDDERKFFDNYEQYFYPYHIGGGFIYPKYDEKLKLPYEDLVGYYLKNPTNLTVIDVKYLIYYLLNEMMSDFNIRIHLYFGNKEFFDENSDTIAYHSIDNGTHLPIICFNPKYIEASIKNKNFFYEFIVSCYHELEHEVQHMLVSSEKITNAQAIIWAKEFVTRNSLGEEYYEKNYTRIFFERDAKDYSEKRMEDNLKRLGVNYSAKKRYDLNVRQENTKTKENMYAIDLVDVIASEAIRVNPNFLKAYPILKNIYNKDGSKKLYSEIESILSHQMRELILAHPELTSNMVHEYYRLAYSVARTDNELFIQKLCLEAYECDKDNDEIGLNSKLNYILDIMKKRDISYKDLVEKLDSRISHLNQIYLKQKSIDVKEELENTKLLKQCLMKYNSEFKKKYDELQDIKTMKKRLEEIVGHSIDNYKFSVGSNYVVAIKKTKEELSNDSLKLQNEVKSKNMSREELKKALEQIRILYSSYGEDLESQHKMLN